MTQTEDYIKEFNEKNEFLLGPKSAFDFQEIYREVYSSDED